MQLQVSLLDRGRKSSQGGKNNVTMEKKLKWCGQSRGILTATRSWKEQKTDSPLPQEGAQPCKHLDFSPVNVILDSSLQNFKRLNVHFKPACLRWFVSQPQKWVWHPSHTPASGPLLLLLTLPGSPSFQTSLPVPPLLQALPQISHQWLPCSHPIQITNFPHIPIFLTHSTFFLSTYHVAYHESVLFTCL